MNDFTQRREVLVHVSFMKLGDISTTQEQFTAKILITARWREPSLDNLPSAINQEQVLPVFPVHCLL